MSVENAGCPESESTPRSRRISLSRPCSRIASGAMRRSSPAKPRAFWEPVPVPEDRGDLRGRGALPVFGGGRKAISVAGVKLKDGHRDSCITRAENPMPRRKLSEEDVQQILQQLGPAPVQMR